jgi:DNA-directed RNA polymerase specialized sigma24 family protein
VGRRWPAVGGARGAFDPAEEVALVARARRELLLGAHRHRLRREDLEDCYSQATLELVSYVRRGAVFSSKRHLANVIEQRFVSRIGDRRRALSGRSPMQAAFEAAVPLNGPDAAEIEIADTRTEPERVTIARQELRRLQVLVRELTPDQRLVLASQLIEADCGEFCRRYGWSSEKYRKVAQRARARLRQMMAPESGDVPPGTCSSEETAGTAYEDLSPHS